jgi:CelD/BcsL family acetyltransferase involved in cellulose biosynthesis
MQRTVTVETITTVDGVAALRPCYERLQQASGNTLPFALHEWHLAWCHHFLNFNPRIRDEPLFYVLRDSEGTCVAVLPFIVSRRRVGPLNIMSIDLLGADPAITEIRAPMIVPGYELLAAHAVQHQLAKTPGLGLDSLERNRRAFRRERRPASFSAGNCLPNRRHANRLRGGRQPVYVLFGLRPRMGPVQRHDHHHGRPLQHLIAARRNWQ